MATLLGQKINATYDSLLKTEDNDGITGSLKQITDGVGQTTPLYLSTTEAKIGGNLEITGDLTVGGTTTYINTDNVTVKDGLVLLANDNVADIIDIGLYGKYNDGTVKYTGLYRDATDGKFKIFDGLTTEPTTTVGGGNLADFAAAGGSFSGNLIVDGNYYSTDGAISLTNGDIVTGGHIAINSGNAPTSFSSNANQLIVGGADSGTNQGMTIASDSGATGNIFFADGITGDEQYRGLITYNHGSDTMYLGTAAANRISIASDGTFTKLGSVGNITLNDGGYRIDFSQQGIIEAAGTGAYLNLIADGVMGLYGSQLSFSRDSGITTDFKVFNNGNVTIGNGTNGDALRIYNSGYPLVKFFDGTTARGLLGYIFDWGNFTLQSESNLVFRTGSSGGSEKMRIDSSGNVGIGNSVASSFNQRVNAPHLVVGSGSNSAGVTIYSGTNAQGSISFADGTTTTEQYMGGIVYVHGSDNYMSFNTNGSSERMRIDSSGNIRVKGNNTRLSWERTSDSAPDIAYFTKTQTISTNGEAVVHGYDGIIFKSSGSETERMRIDSSGKVGIGGTPTGLLTLQRQSSGADTDIDFLNEIGAGPKARFRFGGTNEELSFWTGGTTLTERMRIDSSGNVGIGTSSPDISGFSKALTIDGADCGVEIANSGVITAIFSGNSQGASISGVGSSGIRFRTSSSGGTTERMRIDSSGSLFFPYLGVSASGLYDLQLLASNEMVIITSSRRYKENIQDLPSTLDNILALRPVTFDEKSTGINTTGLIAEEVYEVLPELVPLKEVEGYDEPQPEAVSYSRLPTYLIKAIQEQQEIINKLEARIQTLENK